MIEDIYDKIRGMRAKYGTPELPELDYDDTLLEEDSTLGELARHAEDRGEPLALWMAIGADCISDEWQNEDNINWVEDFIIYTYPGYGEGDAIRERLYDALEEAGLHYDDPIYMQILELIRLIPTDVLRRVESRNGCKFYYSEANKVTYTAVNTSVYDGLVRL